jgi:hypothetical protein
MILLAVSVSNVLERLFGMNAIDRAEEYVEILIVPFILLYAYSWSATSRLEKNREYVGELHHRVKNNLQIVESLLDVQAMLSDVPAANALLAARKNIEVLGLTERTLLERDESDRLDMSALLGDVVNRIAADNPASARCDLRCDSVVLPRSVGVHCAIIVSAWLADAPGNAQRLSASLEASGDGRCRLTLLGYAPSPGNKPGIFFRAIASQLGSATESEGSFILEFEAGTGSVIT